METILAVLPTKAEAEKVVHEFEVLGIARSDIKIVPSGKLEEIELSGRHPAGQECPMPCGRSLSERVERAKRTNAEAARAGLIRGIVLGFVTTGLFLFVPGTPAHTPARAIAILVAGTVICGIFGALILRFYNMGLPHEEAALYEEAAHEGGVVVAAHVTGERERAALKVLKSHRARDIHAAADAAQVSAWAARYPIENPYPCDSTKTD